MLIKRILKKILLLEWIAIPVLVLVFIVSALLLNPEITGEKNFVLASIIMRGSVKGFILVVFIIPLTYTIRAFLSLFFLMRTNNNIVDIGSRNIILAEILRVLCNLFVLALVLYFIGIILIINWIPVQDATEEVLREVQSNVAINYDLGCLILGTMPYVIVVSASAISIISVFKLILKRE